MRVQDPTGAAPPTPFNKPLAHGKTPGTRHASNGSFSADDDTPTHMEDAGGGISKTIAGDRVGEEGSGRGAAGDPELSQPAGPRRGASEPANLPIRAQWGRTPSKQNGPLHTPTGPVRNARIFPHGFLRFWARKPARKMREIFMGLKCRFFRHCSPMNISRICRAGFRSGFRAGLGVDFRADDALDKIPGV